jgi:membrane-associated phospholipid phosphatase
MSARPSTACLVIESERTDQWWQLHSFLIVIASGILAIWFSVYFLDDPAISLFQTHRLPGELRRLIMLSEAFAHGTGVMGILLVIWSFRRSDWRRLMLVAAMAYGSGLAANFFKLLVCRIRPASMHGVAIDSITSFQRLGLTTFGDLLSENANSMQSFPSAHTATAFGFAFGLTWYFGGGRITFLLLACLAALQRVVAGSHWPSDVIAGATVAYLVLTIQVCAFRRLSPDLKYQFVRERRRHDRRCG